MRQAFGADGFAPLAVQADQPLRIAVELDHVAAARDLVQVVDVLGDDRLDPAGSFQGGDAEMGGVGPGRSEKIVEDLLDLQPGFLGLIQEIADLDEAGVHPAPQAAGAAEGGDAAFDRNAGAAEHGDVAGARQQTSRLSDEGGHGSIL